MTNNRLGVVSHAQPPTESRSGHVAIIAASVKICSLEISYLVLSALIVNLICSLYSYAMC